MIGLANWEGGIVLLLLEFVLAMLPIIWLIAALSGLKMAGHKDRKSVV